MFGSRRSLDVSFWSLSYFQLAEEKKFNIGVNTVDKKTSMSSARVMNGTALGHEKETGTASGL